MYFPIFELEPNLEKLLDAEYSGESSGTVSGIVLEFSSKFRHPSAPNGAPRFCCLGHLLHEDHLLPLRQAPSRM